MFIFILGLTIVSIVAFTRTGRIGRWVLGLTALLMASAFGLFMVGMFWAHSVPVRVSESSHYLRTTQPASPDYQHALREFENLKEQRRRMEIEKDLSRITDELQPVVVADANNKNSSVTAYSKSVVNYPQSWAPEAEVHFLADVYPSARSAAAALAGQLLENPAALETILTKDQVPEALRILGNVDGGILGHVADVARERFPSAAIEIINGLRDPLLPAEDSTGKVMVAILVEKMGPSTSNNSDTIKVSLVSPTGGKTSRSIPWVDKPWVENPVEYAAKQPNKHYSVAHCPQLVTNQQEAIDLAIAEAAKKIEPLVRDCLNNHERLWESRYTSAEQEKLIKKIANQLQLGYYSLNYIEDRFVQGFDRPYGRVWRGAVLVSATPANISYLSQEVQKSIRLRTESAMQEALSIAGLVLLIIVVYLFLNAATKGYYIWSLRIAGVVLLLAGILVVLNFA